MKTSDILIRFHMGPGNSLRLVVIGKDDLRPCTYDFFGSDCLPKQFWDLDVHSIIVDDDKLTLICTE